MIGSQYNGFLSKPQAQRAVKVMICRGAWACNSSGSFFGRVGRKPRNFRKIFPSHQAKGSQFFRDGKSVDVWVRRIFHSASAGIAHPQLAQVPLPRHHIADWVGRRRDSCVLTR
jgi:hypothetical protein